MADPVTLATGAIVTLAFQKFFESGVEELAKKFTSGAIAKMDKLAKRIWGKLTGNQPVDEIKQEIDKQQKITIEQINKVTSYLEVAMDEDPKFAEEIRLLANEIHAGKIVYQSSMKQEIHDHAKGWQTKVEGGTAYIGDIQINHEPD
jgi:hypothetical protein